MEVDNQPHYAGLRIEPIEIIKNDMTLTEYRGFLKGNIIKYALRNKGSDQEDHFKLAVYAKWLKESYVENQKEV